jgi:hypothetical protein
MNIKRTIFLISIFILGCQESWQNLKTDEDKQYMYFVGMSMDADSFEEGMQTATTDAISNIVIFFGARASKEVEVLITELNTKIKGKIDVTGKEPLLEGLYIDKCECKEKEKDVSGKKQKAYDITLRLKYSKEAIEKEKKRLKRETEEHSRLAKEYLLEAEKAEEKGEVISAFQDYFASLRSANIAFDKTSHAVALSSIGNLVQRIVLSKDNEGPILKIKAVLRSKQREIPIRDLPLTFRFAQADESIIKTNLQGIASLSPTRLPGLINMVEVTINTEQAFLFSSSDFPEKDTKEIQKAFNFLKKEKVEFVLTKNLGRVIFSISCKNLGKEVDVKIVESKLSSRLVGFGQKIVSQEETETVKDLLKDGDLASLKLLGDTIITGEFSTRRGAKLENELFSSFTAGSLKVIDLGSRDIIFQKEVSDVTGFGLDMESAGIDALNKASSLMADYLCGGER